MMYFSRFTDIYKVCSEEKSTDQNAVMVSEFFSALLKIPSCTVYTKLQQAESLFSVYDAVEAVFRIKSLPQNNLVLARNITYCFHGIRLVNIVYNRIIEMKTEKIDIKNDTHIALLESLWMNMKPNTRRSTDTLLSPDWLALGFQGNDPTTDFRSLGLLGLYQLVYFSLHRTPIAQMVLQELSRHPGKYYPFAVIGINISQFVMELFHEYRLHRAVFDSYRNIMMACSPLVRDAPSDDGNCVNYCAETIHDVYCVVFEEFYLLWVVRDPADIMAFNDLFAELKATLRQRYASLAGDA